MTNIVRFHFCELPGAGQLVGTEEEAGGRDGWRAMANEGRASLWDNETVLEVDSGDGRETVRQY